MRPRQLLAWLPALMMWAALLAPTAAFATQTQTMHFSATDSRAASQSVVKYDGGPCTSGRCVATARNDSCFVVQKASPAISARSA